MGDRLANVRLVLFFTRGLSLRVWDEIGILDREAASIAEWHRRSVDHIRDLRRSAIGSNAGWVEFECSPIAGACPPGSMSGI